MLGYLFSFLNLSFNIRFYLFEYLEGFYFYGLYLEGRFLEEEVELIIKFKNNKRFYVINID